jgi:hypothetical protein
VWAGCMSGAVLADCEQHCACTFGASSCCNIWWWACAACAGWQLKPVSSGMLRLPALCVCEGGGHVSEPHSSPAVHCRLSNCQPAQGHAAAICAAAALGWSCCKGSPITSMLKHSL